MKNAFRFFSVATLARDVWFRQTIAIFLTVAVFGLVASLVVTRREEVRMKKEAEQVISSLSQVIATPAWNLESDAIQRILGSFHDSPSIISLGFYDEHGEVLAKQLNSKDVPSFSLSREIEYEGQVIGQLKGGFSSKAVVNAAVEQLTEALVLLVILVSAMSIVTARALKRLVVTPLEELGRGMDALARGDYTTALASGNLPEMEVLIQKLNGLALELAERERKGFDRHNA